MNYLHSLLLGAVLLVLTLAAYIDRIYSEMGKFLARQYQDNIDVWEAQVEPRLRLDRDTIAISASVLHQLALVGLTLIFGVGMYTRDAQGLLHGPTPWGLARTVAELVLLVLIFDRLLPQILFTRARGLWAVPLRPLLLVLLLLVQPVVLALGLLLSIAALAEPEEKEDAEHPSEAMDALLEAGEEEGILEESDRELVRSAVEFGDKLVREIMTPRPEIFAVPDTTTLQAFTALIEAHAFSRVPVYSGKLDEITGLAFAHDLLQIPDTEAASRTVAEIQRAAAFVPETKHAAELLREMQREKQHMRLVIDEYGGVAGLVTIEDLLEAIVGEIHDEHDTPEDEELVTTESDGSLLLGGTFEITRLRDLLLDQMREPAAESHPESADAATPTVAPPNPAGELEEEEDDPAVAPGAERREDARVAVIQRLGDDYEATTLGGLVSEMAGHIPHPGEVVEENGLRFEVLAATDRRINRVRVTLAAGETPQAA